MNSTMAAGYGPTVVCTAEQVVILFGLWSFWMVLIESSILCKEITISSVYYMAENGKDMARIGGQAFAEIFGIGKPVSNEINVVGENGVAGIRGLLSLGHQFLESYLVDPAQIFPDPTVVNEGALAQIAVYNSKILNMMAE